MDNWILFMQQILGIKPFPVPKVYEPPKPGSSKKHDRYCEICEEYFIGTSTQKYCSDVCAITSKRIKDRSKSNKDITNPNMIRPISKDKTIICVNCKQKLEITSGNHLRCRPCAKAHKREWNRNYEKQKRIEAREKLNKSKELE